MGPLKMQMPKEMFEPAAFKTYEGSADVGILKSGPDLYDFKEPVHWEADVTNTGGALLVTGTVWGEATGSCARCLSSVEIPITGEIEGYFLISADEEAPEDMEGDEFEYLAPDKSIDMAPLIQQALLLDIPMLALCSDDCKGLCPKCGKDLNDGPCDCPDDDPDEHEDGISPDNPFAALKDIELG